MAKETCVDRRIVSAAMESIAGRNSGIRFLGANLVDPGEEYGDYYYDFGDKIVVLSLGEDDGFVEEVEPEDFTEYLLDRAKDIVFGWTDDPDIPAPWEDLDPIVNIAEKAGALEVAEWIKHLKGE